MKYTLLGLAFVLSLLFTTCSAFALGTGGALLKMPYPDHYFDSLRWETYMNADSVLVDSGSGSPTYLEYYATKGWGIDFAYYVIHREPAPYDTTIELSWTGTMAVPRSRGRSSASNHPPSPSLKRRGCLV